MLDSYKPKEWAEKRKALEQLLHEVGHTQFTRIVRSAVYAVSLEGSSLQMSYSLSSCELSVYGRGGSRYAGSSYKVSELLRIQGAFRTWQAKYIEV